MALSAPLIKSLATTTFKEISNDDVPSLAAAIAYYTVFSLPPLLVLIVALAGFFFGADRVASEIANQAGAAVGDGAAESIRTMIDSAGAGGSGIGGKLLGIGALLFGATGAFGQLQKALNRAWEVDDTSKEGGVVSLILKRVASFGMILTIAFLLLVSLAVSTAITVVGDAALGGMPTPLAQALNTALSLAVITALFAVMFKVLPDAEIAWRDVWVGALVTALLFTLGKYLIGLYLGTADPGSAFGAAGSLALLLVWIYYSSLIVLVGAEFTQAWSQQVGGGISPESEGGRRKKSHGTSTEVTVGGADSEVHPIAKPRDPAPY